ncbi:MAG: sigma-54-dependent Fis family transcriptional regulator [Acidobacteria bacterium]|nr:MAG: sigma-54-dependent Fis family transcriptional regulator [Acidobacteriota bacterium]
MPQPSILVIDDEEVMRDVMSRLLEQEGYSVTLTSTPSEGLEALSGGVYDVILLDLMLPEKNGLVLLPEILQVDPDAVVIILTAYGSIESAVQATRGGAFDFLTKPFQNDQFLLAVRNGITKRNLEAENRQLKKNFREQFAFQSIVGKSEQMNQVFELIGQVGPSRSTVLITGESGTGKELVAKALHNCSNRANRPFVAVNSGTIPSELLESELFGHVKGAFTGATATKKGLFEIANEGTIFLDEVGTIPLETQAKLLRVIQEREFRRVGGLENIKVDVRILAATNIDLKHAVETGAFREDLFYRLNVITLTLPSLRERKEDIALLVEHFVVKYSSENGRPPCRFDQQALRTLMEYDWPGNVRELENLVERAVVLAPADGVITRDLFPRDLLHSSSVGLGRLGALNHGGALKELMQDYERNLIVAALEKTAWNQKKAADLLRVNATTLNEKLKRLKIKVP